VGGQLTHILTFSIFVSETLRARADLLTCLASPLPPSRISLSTGVDIKNFVMPPPKGTIEDSLKELAEKTGLLFLV
jgi:hypothetical protein